MQLDIPHASALGVGLSLLHLAALKQVNKSVAADWQEAGMSTLSGMLQTYSAVKALHSQVELTEMEVQSASAAQVFGVVGVVAHFPSLQ